MRILSLFLYFIFATLLTTALPYSGLLVPIVLILSAALFVAMSVKWNVFYSVFSAVFAGLLIYIISDLNAGTTAIFVSAITFPVVSLLSSLGIYISLKFKTSVKTTLLAGTTGYFALIAAAYFLFGGAFIADIINLAKSTMMDSLDAIINSVPTGSDIASIEEIKLIYELYFENLKILAPSIILSLFFLLSYFTIKVSSLFAKDKKFFSSVPAFSEIHAPFFIVILGIISYLGQLSENMFISGLMANVFMVLSVYLTLCGFSLIDFFVKFRIKSLAARISIYIGVTFLLTLLSAVFYFANPILIAMLLGLVDSLFNYRIKIHMLRGK